MQSETAISRELMGKIVDEVFDGAIEDSRVIEEIYAIIKREEATVSAAEPVEGHVDWDNPNDPAVKLFVGFDVEAYVDEYELRGDEGDYSPNEQEKTLLVDAIYSVVGNLHESLRKLIPSSLPPQQTVSSAAVKTLKDAANDVIACASDTYKKRNGHLASFEDESGEKCWIVPFDAFEALRSTLSAQVQDASLRVGRFGHHPEPAIDYCIEVEALEGHLFDAKHGIGKPGHKPRKIDDDFRRRVSDAMDFIVGGDQVAIAAKATLRSISAQVQADSPAIKAIAAERRRQIEQEGWSAHHDDAHGDGSMALAAACYAMFAAVSDNARISAQLPGSLTTDSQSVEGWAAFLSIWPWERHFWKPTTRVRDLEKAGALIAAELDRVIRAAAPAKQEGGQ